LDQSHAFNPGTNRRTTRDFVFEAQNGTLFLRSDYGGYTQKVNDSTLTLGLASTTYGYAVIKQDGSVVTWESYDGYGGDYGGDSSSVASLLASSVQAVYSTDRAFAAVKSDGSVVVWGSSGWGGDSSTVSGSLTSGVSVVYSTKGAFAALKNDGSVVVWGGGASDDDSMGQDVGADSSSVSGSLTSVSVIFSTSSAFAALKSGGSVVTWGSSSGGGDSSSVSSDLTSGVSVVYSTDSAFAALKSGGSVVTWGSSSGGGDSSSVSSDLTSGVVSIAATSYAFAAIKSDGSVITWGDDMNGGDPSITLDDGDVSGNLTSGVQAIFSIGSSFVALKSDGSLVLWGDMMDMDAGRFYEAAEHVTSGVVAVYSAYNKFCALKNDGSFAHWGNNGYGIVSAASSGGTLQVYGSTLYHSDSSHMYSYYNECNDGYSNIVAATDGTVTADYTTCSQCAAGSYDNGVSCSPCPIGRYSGSAGSTTCDTCASGKSTGSLGSASASDCLPCAAGEYPVTGSGCDACLLGTYQPDAGSGSCLDLPDGYTSPDRVTAQFCDEDSTIVYQSSYNSYGATLLDSMECELCPTYYFSYCGDLKVYDSTQYYFCKFPCELFSLDMSQGALVGLAAILVIAFLCCFAFIRKPATAALINANNDVHAVEDTATENKIDKNRDSEDNEGTSAIRDEELAVLNHDHKTGTDESEKKVVEDDAFDGMLAFKLFIYVSIPVSDTFTDLAYVASARFYSILYFALSMFFFLIPNLAFCRHLVAAKLRPHLLLPLYDKVPDAVKFNEYDSIDKLLIGFVVSFPWMLLNLPYLFPKLLLGCFLYSTKVLAIGPVQTMWNRLWTGSTEFDVVNKTIDSQMLNESIYVEILAETFPQVRVFPITAIIPPYLAISYWNANPPLSSLPSLPSPPSIRLYCKS
jgi:hypothetical protein